MPKRSAGILMFRRRGGEVEVLLMHPGGPFWAKEDLGAWSIPKGEYSEGEDALAVAKREFEEETGARPQGDFLPLGEVIQAGRKIVTAWGLEGDFDSATLTSNRLGVVSQSVVFTNSSGVLSMERGPGGGIYFSDSGAIYKLIRT